MGKSGFVHSLHGHHVVCKHALQHVCTPQLGLVRTAWRDGTRLTRPLLRRKNSVGTIFTGAFLFGIGFDTATQMWWDRHNKGVRIQREGGRILTLASACDIQKQWADIRDKVCGLL